MARYTFGVSELEAISETTFQKFVELVKGRSIVSLGDWGPDRVELGLSGSVMVRILLAKTGIEINTFSTQNPGEPFAFTLSLGEMPRRVSALQLDTKLRGLRTAFAILFLLANNHENDLAAYLLRHPYGDIDRALLPPDTLQIESLSYGSWIATVYTKTREAFDALWALGTVVFPRTRDAFLKKTEAEAELKAIEAKRGAKALERETFELAKDRTNYILDLANRIEDNGAKEILQQRLKSAFYELATGDTNEKEIRTTTRLMLPQTKLDKDEED